MHSRELVGIDAGRAVELSDAGELRDNASDAGEQKNTECPACDPPDSCPLDDCGSSPSPDASDTDASAVDAGDDSGSSDTSYAGNAGTDAGQLEQPNPGEPCAPCETSSQCATRPPIAGNVCSDIGQGSRCYPFNSDCAALGWLQRGALCVPKDGCR